MNIKTKIKEMTTPQGEVYYVVEFWEKRNVFVSKFLGYLSEFTKDLQLDLTSYSKYETLEEAETKAGIVRDRFIESNLEDEQTGKWEY